MEGQGEARWSFRNFLEIFPFVGHINFEGDRRRCTENISRRQCHGSSRIPSSAIPKMDKPGGEGFDRERVIYHEGLARETFQKTYRERGKEGGGDVCVLHLTYPAFYIRSVEKRGRGAESRHTRKPPRGWILFSSRDNLLAARKWRTLPGFGVIESAE